MTGDRNRCTEKRIRDFHLWEGKTREHLSHKEDDLIVVMGHTLLFNECFFSASPLIPIVNIVLLVWLQCIAPKTVCLLDAYMLELSRHFNVT